MKHFYYFSLFYRYIAPIVCWKRCAKNLSVCLIHYRYWLYCLFFVFSPFFISLIVSTAETIWATTRQNQQSECAPSEDSDQPGHLPSLIRVFAICMKKAWVLSYPLSSQRRLWSDWADAQADLSLRWAHSHFVGFVMSQLIYWLHNQIKLSKGA